MPYFDEYAGFDQNMRDEGTPPPAPSPAPEKNTHTAAHTIFDYAEMLILTVVFVLLATTFLFRHTVVVGGSMNNTLKDGQHLIISDVFYSPKRGDIVVIENKEETGIDTPIIKRVIGIAGDTIEIKRDGVYLNGSLLEESYAVEVGNDYLSYGFTRYDPSAANIDKTVYTYHIGEGEVFVLGDNRFHSEDSRMFGAVTEKAILGRVILRLTPFEKFGGVK